MNLAEQKRAAKAFCERWRGRGDEKQDCQSFWTDFLEHVLDVPYASQYVQFEKKVDLGKDAKTGRTHTGFIDGYIPSTKVLIEQKTAKINLRKAAQQSDGTELTPYQQAKRYADRMTNDMRPRWIVVSNFQEIIVYDLNESLDTPQIELTLEDLVKESHRLSFLVDKEKAVAAHELQVSLQAGELVGKLYDALEKQYVQPMTPEAYQSLNKLCVRLVFCLYAEDSGLFETKSQFHDYLVSQGKIGLGRIHAALRDLFRILNTKKEERDPYEEADLNAFPYVNGGLFADDRILIPPFSDEAFNLLVNKASEGFDWSEISPTIFGSVFESTLNAETRRQGGMHYTSIENIHKVIDPLFLDDLKAEFAELKKSVADRTKITPRKKQEFQEFQTKLGKLKFLDPACGSGNFLTETYLSLRRLENDVIREISGGQQSFGDDFSPIQVHINQFYGIEINDFAAVVAKTALWIAESQMMTKTREIVDVHEDFLPLKSAAHIVEGNALRLDWNEVVPASELDYIMGNPPFLGYSFQNAEQKEDLRIAYAACAGKADYVAGWYFKAAKFIKDTPVRCAFVSTNSLAQGSQVPAVWRPLFEEFGVHIDFAWRTFKWTNDTKKAAAVHVVIIGFSALDNDKSPVLFDEQGSRQTVDGITPYLTKGAAVFIEDRSMPLSTVTPMISGGKPVEGGFLILTEEEKAQLLQHDPLAASFIRPYMMGKDFIDRKPRYCLWLVGADPSVLKRCPNVLERMEAVRQFRLSSKKTSTRKKAETPGLFDEIKESSSDYVAIPRVSSENRCYIPMDFLLKDVIAGDMLYMVPSRSEYEFGVMTSSVHMDWMRAVAGRLEMRYRYSNTIVYNNFVWPEPTEEQKLAIEKTATAILDARKRFPDASLADLYDDLTMPPELRKAHKDNDRAVMKAYGFKSSMTESEIVAELFKLYQKKVDELAEKEAAAKAAKKKRTKKADKQ